MGGGPRVVVSTAAFHARVRGSVPGLDGLKETKMFLPHPRVKVSIVGSLRDRDPHQRHVIGRDVHLDQSHASHLCQLVWEYRPWGVKHILLFDFNFFSAILLIF